MVLWCRDYLFDCSVRIEFHPVNTYFAVPARSVIQMVLVDTVVYDIPFVFSRYLQDRVVGRSVDFFFWILNEYYRGFGYFDRTEW